MEFVFDIVVLEVGVMDRFVIDFDVEVVVSVVLLIGVELDVVLLIDVVVGVVLLVGIIFCEELEYDFLGC